MYPNIELPPQPKVTRWGTWIATAIYYAENIIKIRDFVAKLDENEAHSIREIKRILENAKLRSNLAFIKCHFGCIPVAIGKLEEKGIFLTDALQIFNSVRIQLLAIPRRKEFLQKFDCVYTKNHGLQVLETIGRILADNEEHLLGEELKEMTPDELQSFKYAPITSCDVERSFSAYKRVLEDFRRSFVFENLRKYLIIHCNNFDSTKK